MNPRRFWVPVFLAVALSIGLTTPLKANEASRCYWNPACLCIWWENLPGGPGYEIRCSSGSGEESGWTNDGPTTGPPEISYPGGTFFGNGMFQGGILHAPEASRDQLSKVRSATSDVERMLGHQDCANLFSNAPLKVEPLWLFRRIQWQDGEEDALGQCLEDPDTVAYYRSPGIHEPIIYLCDSFAALRNGTAALHLIHELLHAFGQIEDGTTTVGPGDFPTTGQINGVVLDACNNFN